MMIKTRILTAILSTTVLFGAVSPASAFRAQDHTVRSVRDAVKDLESTNKELHDLLVRALRLQTGEQSAYSDKSTEAMKRIEDASNQNQVELARQQIRAKAESGEFDPNPAACLLLDLFSGNGGEGGSNTPPNGTTVVAEAQAKARQIGDKGPAAGAYDMSQLKFPAGDGTFASAGKVFLSEPTVDLSDPQMKEAAENFYLAITDPIPMKKIDPKTANTPEVAAQLAIQNGREGRSSVIGENWSMTNNMSTPTTPSDNVKGLLEGINYNRPVPDKISELQVLDLLVLSNYLPGPLNEGSSTPGQNLDKIHKLLSVMARMQYMQLELDRRQLMTNSLMLSKMIENDGNFSN